MIQITPPRFTGTYDIVSSYEPDLDRPAPPERLDGEEQAAYEARAREALAPWHRLLAVARDTGDWSGLLKPGAEPTLFKARPIAGRRWLAWDTYVADDRLSELQRAALLVRMAIVSVERWVPKFSLGRQVEHLDRLGRPTGIGPVASEDLIDSFYLARPGDEATDMIIDLGLTIYRHRMISSGN